MADEKTENLNSSNEGGEGNPEIDTLTEEQLAELSGEERLARVEKQFKDYLKKNQELFARAKKAEERIKKMREAAIEEEEKPKIPELIQKEIEEARFERYDLRLAGYDEEETEYLISLGGKKALQRQFVPSF